MTKEEKAEKKKEELIFKEKLAKIFKEARKSKNWTQKEVAKRAKSSFNYYARIERAGVKGPMPKGYVLDNIARALEIKLVFPLD